MIYSDHLEISATIITEYLIDAEENWYRRPDTLISLLVLLIHSLVILESGGNLRPVQISWSWQLPRNTRNKLIS
jgi:hypothetical protein